MLRELEAGVFGGKLRLPTRLRAVEERADSVDLIDDSRATVWHVFYFHELAMDLGATSDLPSFIAAAHHYARSMFVDAFIDAHKDDPDVGTKKPRTDDANWSPLIEVERVTLGDAPVLTILHRMFYEPGCEFVMGHVLIPLAAGLLEVRMFSRGIDPTTGIRSAA